MSVLSKSNDEASDQNIPAQKLMVNGFVCFERGCPLSVEVRRGMSIRSKGGQEAGKVAAVVLNSENCKATHLLLSRLPEVSGYWLVSVDLIVKLQGGDVWLNLTEAMIEALPRWRPT